jgi:hypothetical protein
MGRPSALESRRFEEAWRVKKIGTVALLAASTFIALSGCSGQTASQGSLATAATPATSSTMHAPITPGPMPASAFAAALDEGKKLIGMTEVHAQQRAKADGFGFQVVQRDGTSLLTRLDLDTGRVDVVIDDGLVAGASAG